MSCQQLIDAVIVFERIVSSAQHLVNFVRRSGFVFFPFLVCWWVPSGQGDVIVSFPIGCGE